MAATKPRVTVCVANYNGADVIIPCLQSVCDQLGDTVIEIIVHDDASTDSSVEIIQSQFPQATLIISAENVGFCHANNKMVARAGGDYVLLLNNDASLAVDAISTFLVGLERWGDSIFTLPQFDAVSDELLDCGMFMDMFANAVPNAERVEQPVAMVMGACLWVSKALWQRCGGLPDWFGSMAEDMYLCNYARLLGHEVVALSDSTYYHHVGHSFGGGKVLTSGLSTTVKRRRLSERNKLFVLFLFYPGPALCLWLPLILLALFLEGLVLALVKWDRSIFTRIYGHALWAFFATLPELWRRRRIVQRRRTISSRTFFSPYRLLPYKLRMLLRYGVPQLH